MLLLNRNICQNIRKESKRGETYLGLLPVQPSSSQRRPSPLAPPLSSSSSTGGWARARRARAAAPRHQPPCLPALSPPRLDAPGDATRPLDPLPLSRVSPSSTLSLPSTTERSSSPPTPLPRPQPSRRLTDAPGSSAPTPSSSPPIHGPPEALQRRPQARPQPSAAGELSRIRELQPLPGLAVASTRSAVSYSSIPPPPRARSRTLAALFTGADCSSPPAMAWSWPQPPQRAPEPTSVLTATLGTQST